MKELDKKDVVVSDVDGDAVDALSADLADVIAAQTDSVEEVQLSLGKKEKELDDSKQDAKESVDVAAADSDLAAMIMAESVDASSAAQGGGAASADGGLSSNGKLLAAAGVVTAAGIAVAASDSGGSGGGSKNEAPVFDGTDQTVDAVEDGPNVSFSVSAQDPNGEAVTYFASAPQNGILTSNAAGTSYTYNPNSNFSGTETITITARDIDGLESTQTITINVAAVNDAPDAQSATATATNANEAVTGNVVATDVDGDTLTYTLDAQPANGTVVLDSATGEYTYTPDSFFAGVDPFTITVSDGTATDAITVRMAVGVPNADKFSAVLDGTGDMVTITGDQSVNIEMTNPANQITGLDLNGNGTIDTDGVENDITGQVTGFSIVNAYPGAPLNTLDDVNNFLGTLNVSGTGFQGDGVNTDGNIVLGGLGVNNIFTGIGNDFVALSNLSLGNNVELGRNADFVHLSFSPNTALSGNTIFNLDGGETFDNDASQDSDWLLLDATDDIETVQVILGNNAVLNNIITNGGGNADADDFEHFSGTGTLHGFLNGYDVNLGEADASGSPINFTLGTTAQLDIEGSNDRNIILGGYDNDEIQGFGGSDVLFGGDMQFLTRNQNNPNILLIPNDGSDKLYGGDGDDLIMFEQDGGIIDGGADHDTLFATDFTSGSEDGDLTTDGVVRLDLLAQTTTTAGYGGADAAGTADQSNYADEGDRVTITNMESIITTGLGGMDFDIDGGNSAEKSFDQQANYYGLEQDVDLRGSNDDNTLYANTGDDVVEGREGNDNLSGGTGNDDFIFALGELSGDGVDVIHRQNDLDGDNIWDGTFGQDFGLDSTTGVAESRLIVDFQATDLSLAQVAVTQFVVSLDGSSYDGGTLAELSAANNASELAAILNANLSAQDADLSVAAVGNTVVITSADGGTFATGIPDTVVSGTATNGTLQTLISAQNDLPPVSQDRLIYNAYEDRLDNELVDDGSLVGSDITLGVDSYAEDLVVDFTADGTRLAEDQLYTLVFNNLTTQDIATITVNGVEYELQVGRDLDGNIIAGEDSNGGTSQIAIQTAFLTRLATFINSFGDDDTAAGSVGAVAAFGTTITLTQNAYSGEETVFMRTPTVVIQNLSNGEPATATVANNSQHEVHLLDFDGRDGALNTDNVVFQGDTGINRATLQTASDAGDTIVGNEAILIDGGVNTLLSTVSGHGNNSSAGSDGAAIFNNTSTNASLAGADFAVHGDDQIFGGNGNDVLSGGTGDDRFYASLGNDTIDGGSNFYAVQVLGEAEARVYVLNTWEAANILAAVPGLAGEVISSVTLIGDNESGVGLASGVFDDTLIAQQRDFTPGVSEFTITLDNYTIAGGIVALPNGGAGTLQVDVDGNGVFEGTTDFTNMENIRTQSGIGKAVAGDGQGNDTLNVVAMSNVVGGAGGISFDLTNGLGQGQVRTIEPGTVVNAANPPVFTMYDAAASFVINVDGVENVLTGTGDDLLTIDETEAAKDNLFSAGLGLDRIDYQNVYGGVFSAESLAQPTVDIIVNSANNTDQVVMTSGRNGLTVATDTLVSVENIALNGFTAQGAAEDDTIDVTNMTSGAVVDYTNGEVRDLSGNVQVVIENIVQMENVHADGDDIVIVDDSGLMLNNATEDTATGTVSRDLELASSFDYDTFDANGDRIAFNNQTSVQITNAVNQGQFTFSLSETGNGVDTDIVDYSAELGTVISVVDFNPSTGRNYVIIDGLDDGDLTDSFDRVDELVGVEGVVAGSSTIGESVIDLTALNEDVNLRYQKISTGTAQSTNIADADTVAVNVFLENQSTSVPFNGFSYIEYYDNGDADADIGESAQWTRIEGSDRNEFIELTGDQSAAAHTFNLRGGDNEVNYNELTRGVELTVNSITTGSGTAPGITSLNVQAKDAGGLLLLGQNDTITSYNGLGSVTGTLRVEASQSQEDSINFGGLANTSTVTLGETEGNDDVVNVQFATGSGDVALTLSGFESLTDGDQDDTYVVFDLSDFLDTLSLVDSAVPDSDTLQLTDGALENFTSTQGALTNVNWSDDSIELDAFEAVIDDENGTLGGAFDFSRLDISQLTQQTDVVSTLGAGESLVLGDLGLFGDQGDANIDVQGFTTIEFTSIAGMGQDVVIDLDLGEFRTAGGTILFTFNAATTFDFSAIPDDMTVSTVDTTPGAGVTIIGDAMDTLTGGAGADFITGGADGDVLDGSFVAAVGEVQTITLAPGVLDGTDEFIISNGLNALAVTASGGAALDVQLGVASADEDQIGAALAGVAVAALETALGYAAGDIASTAYDATSNEFSITFAPTAAFADVAVAVGNAGSTAIVEGGGAAGAAATATVTAAAAETTPYAAQADAVDTFIYNQADESVADATGMNTSIMDTILNWDNTDMIDISAIDDALGNNVLTTFTTGGTLADYSAIEAMADSQFGGGTEIFVADDGTDSWVFVDSNDNGDYDVGSDTVIFFEDTLNGAITNANFII